jgi:DNA-binding response OmpR family regulator
MKNILIIEDDRTLSNGILLTLKSEDYYIQQSFDLSSARQALLRERFELLILDINLPDGSGLNFLKEFRQMYETKVILLTANDMETDIVLGLEMGADDYITKPFSLAVLRARVKSQLRRSSDCMGEVVTVDSFRFDFEKMEYHKGSTPIELSKTEQKLLRILVRNSGKTLSRPDLVDRIWTDGAEYVDENALSVTVKRLRDKLEYDSSKPEYIKTVYGIGYVWEGNKG